MTLPYVVGGATGFLVGAVEQYFRLTARFTLHNQAWLWWALRLLLEVGAALLAVLILRATKTEAAHELWGWIAAGAGGAAVLRLRFLDFGPESEARPIGPALAYEPLRQLIEQQLHSRCAERQAWWINRNLLPRLERHDVDPAELAHYVIDYLQALPANASLDKAKEIAYIQSVRDGPESPRIKREALAIHAVTIKAYRLLDQFLKAAGEDPAPRPPIDTFGRPLQG